MKQRNPHRFLANLAIALGVGLGLCSCEEHKHDSQHDSGQGHVPVFYENEVNDTELEANYFGVLAPGDHFIIEGYITDDGFDPFDGFAFNSLGPISVDFDLFIDRPGTDLDLCLFDVESGDEFCFQSSDNPEYGTIDVFADNVDFHLVVESYMGCSTYGLEIQVYELLPNEAQGPGSSEASASAAPASRNMQPRVSADIAARRRPQADEHAFEGYAKIPLEPAEAPRIQGQLIVIEFDPESGEVSQQQALIVD